MKPDITVERLYDRADMTQVRDLSFLEGCHRIIHLLEEAKKSEIGKPMLEDFDAAHWHWRVAETDTCCYHLITAQSKAQDFWRGVIKMVTEMKDEDM